ncbi:MAG: hypothetical protein Q7V10_05495 [Methanobacteriaceae archaeon]|jgi:hypothetical protein|nr:hypothetical protein [Methanobacteriaceae archaeon]MDO9627743.1 hypothetical protein [Methanobacteriaceae archaeon]
MENISKKKYWLILLVIIFSIASISSLYEFIISHSIFQLFMAIAFFLFLVYDLFRFKGHYNKIFWIIMGLGIAALDIIVVYSYVNSLYQSAAGFLFYALIAGLGSFFLVGLIFEERHRLDEVLM